MCLSLLYDLSSIILTNCISIAEQFGTVMVSSAPGLASFWHNIFTKTWIYASLHSKLLRWSSSAKSKECHRYPSDEYLANITMKKYDPYRVTDLGPRSDVSENEPCPEERFMDPGGLVTSIAPNCT